MFYRGFPYASMSQVGVLDPIIIVGSGRSGSTIFFEALAHHPDLAWISNYDSKFASSRLAAMHHYLRRNRHLDLLLTTKKPQNKVNRSLADKLLVRPEEAYRKWNLLCEENFSKDMLHGVQASGLSKQRVIKFYQTVLKRQNRQRPVIKVTGPTRIDYLSSIFTEACFVHITRDPRAVVSSILKTDYWQESMTEPRWNNCLAPGWQATWASYDKNPVALIAMQYRAIMDSCEIEKSRLSAGRYAELQYSEFVLNPAATLERIMAFAGLRLSSEVLEYASEPGRYKDMDWKYKTALSSEDISIIEEIIGL